MSLTFDQTVRRKKGSSLSQTVLKTVLFHSVCSDSAELSRNDSIIHCGNAVFQRRPKQQLLQLVL